MVRIRGSAHRHNTDFNRPASLEGYRIARQQRHDEGPSPRPTSSYNRNNYERSIPPRNHPSINNGFSQQKRFDQNFDNRLPYGELLSNPNSSHSTFQQSNKHFTEYPKQNTQPPRYSRPKRNLGFGSRQTYSDKPMPSRYDYSCDNDYRGRPREKLPSNYNSYRSKSHENAKESIPDVSAEYKEGPDLSCETTEEPLFEEKEDNTVKVTSIEKDAIRKYSFSSSLPEEDVVSIVIDEDDERCLSLHSSDEEGRQGPTQSKEKTKRVTKFEFQRESYQKSAPKVEFKKSKYDKMDNHDIAESLLSLQHSDPQSSKGSSRQEIQKISKSSKTGEIPGRTVTGLNSASENGEENINGLKGSLGSHEKVVSPKDKIVKEQYLPNVKLEQLNPKNESSDRNMDSKADYRDFKDKTLPTLENTTSPMLPRNYGNDLDNSVSNCDEIARDSSSITYSSPFSFHNLHKSYDPKKAPSFKERYSCDKVKVSPVGGDGENSKLIQESSVNGRNRSSVTLVPEKADISHSESNSGKDKYLTSTKEYDQENYDGFSKVTSESSITDKPKNEDNGNDNYNVSRNDNLNMRKDTERASFQPASFSKRLNRTMDNEFYRPEKKSMVRSDHLSRDAFVNDRGRYGNNRERDSRKPAFSRNYRDDMHNDSRNESFYNSKESRIAYRSVDYDERLSIPKSPSRLEVKDPHEIIRFDGRDRQVQGQVSRGNMREARVPSPKYSTLPLPWEAHVSSKGETYYFNTETEESTWEIPQSYFQQLDSNPSTSRFSDPSSFCNGRSQHKRNSHSPPTLGRKWGGSERPLPQVSDTYNSFTKRSDFNGVRSFSKVEYERKRNQYDDNPIYPEQSMSYKKNLSFHQTTSLSEKRSFPSRDFYDYPTKRQRHVNEDPSLMERETLDPVMTRGKDISLPPFRGGRNVDSIRPGSSRSMHSERENSIEKPFPLYDPGRHTGRMPHYEQQIESASRSTIQRLSRDTTSEQTDYRNVEFRSLTQSASHQRNSFRDPSFPRRFNRY